MDPENSAELAERLRFWRAHLVTVAARVRPLADELRSRSWVEMARDIRDVVLQS
jgi:hypothetical protein